VYKETLQTDTLFWQIR